MAKALRVAFYLRVSTSDQTTENQRPALEAMALARGWTVAHVYSDEGLSGSLGREKRPQLDLLLKDAVRRRFDVVLVWGVDRLGRSTATVSGIMSELDRLGVFFVALKEGMDTTTAHGRAMLQMSSVFAELERSLIVDRVKAGMVRAKAEQDAGRVRRDMKGRKLLAIGRPKVSDATDKAIRSRLSAGAGIIKVAKELGVGNSTVSRIKQDMSKALPATT